MSNITSGSVYQVIPTETSTDFTGFTFKGIHSSELNIVRVSMGSRYSDSLLPTHNDKTAQVPGANGTYYFRTDYTQRNFPLNIAFDSVTEQNIRKMRQLFGVNEMGILTFDESPYKEYTVKASDTINLQYICFSEINKYFSILLRGFTAACKQEKETPETDELSGSLHSDTARSGLPLRQPSTRRNGAACVKLFSKYARTTPGVPSGRMASWRWPASSNVYISFCTMSVVSPVDLTNSSFCSTVGRRSSENP